MFTFLLDFWEGGSKDFIEETVTKRKVEARLFGRSWPLEFDGTADSLLQPYDARQRRNMEYVRDRGLFDDVPFEALAADMRATYPRLVAAVEARSIGARFDADAIHRERS